MGKEDGRSFGIKGAIELVKRKLGKVNPVAASVEGPELTLAEIEEQHLRNLLGTKRHADDVDPNKKIPFGDVQKHRRRRGLR